MLTKKVLTLIESLLILVALDRYGGKRKAASVLNISVDTLSKSIENLEADLGAVLVVNDGRGSYLTPKGKEIANEFSKIEKEFADVRSKNFLSLEGEISFGIRCSIKFLNIIDNFTNILHYHEKVNVKCFSFDSPQELSRLCVDICMDHEKFDESNWEVVATYNIPCAMQASKKYIEQYGEPKDMNDVLENHRLIKSTSSNSHMKELSDFYKKVKRVCFQSNNFFYVRDLANYGSGIAMLDCIKDNKG